MFTLGSWIKYPHIASNFSVYYSEHMINEGDAVDLAHPHTIVFMLLKCVRKFHDSFVSRLVDGRRPDDIL